MAVVIANVPPAESPASTICSPVVPGEKRREVGESAIEKRERREGKKSEEEREGREGGRGGGEGGRGGRGGREGGRVGGWKGGREEKVSVISAQCDVPSCSKFCRIHA